MTHDETYLEPAQKAVDYCVKIQAPEGGWRYQPGVDSDLSVTGWFAMAMQSARMAGLEVPSPVFDRIGKFLDTVARDEGARYAYQFNAGATKPLTAEGLLCRQYLGWAHDDPRLRNGVDYSARQSAGLERSQRVLLVLRHAGLPSHGRRGLAEVERGDAAAAAGAPGEAGPGTRQLGPERRPLGRRGRPAVRDLPVALHARSLLPPFADLPGQGDACGQVISVAAGLRAVSRRDLAHPR